MALFNSANWKFADIETTKREFKLPPEGEQYIQIKGASFNKDTDNIVLQCKTISGDITNYRLSYYLTKKAEDGNGTVPNNTSGGTIKTLAVALIGPDFLELVGEDFTMEQFVDYINEMASEETPVVVSGTLKHSEGKTDGKPNGKIYLNCYSFESANAEVIEGFGNPEQQYIPEE